MNRCDPVSDVAGNTRGSGAHTCSMVMQVLIEIEGVAFAAGVAVPRVLRQNIGCFWPIDWVFEGWWCRVAVGAAVSVNKHRVVGRVAKCDAGRVIKHDTEASCRVVDRTMGGSCLLVQVAGEAVYGRLIGVVNHHLHGGAGGRDRVDVAGCVVAGGADVKM